MQLLAIFCISLATGCAGVHHDTSPVHHHQIGDHVLAIPCRRARAHIHVQNLLGYLNFKGQLAAAVFAEVLRVKSCAVVRDGRVCVDYARGV